LLTPLQVRVAEIVKDLPESAGFALAGGGALVVQGVINRTTRDLDYFTTPEEAETLIGLRDALKTALEQAGLDYVIVRDLPTFVRLEVQGDQDRCEVDLAVDYRALPPERSEFGPTLAVKELAANKVLAVFDRAEARDFRDLAALVDQFPLDELMRLATDKDPGFDKTGFIEALNAFDRLDPEEFDLDIDDYRRLRTLVSTWRQQLERHLGRDDPGLSLG